MHALSIVEKGQNQMPFKDLREFIARLEKEGEVQRIEEEVDWNLEAGAIRLINLRYSVD